MLEHAGKKHTRAACECGGCPKRKSNKHILHANVEGVLEVPTPFRSFPSSSCLIALPRRARQLGSSRSGSSRTSQMTLSLAPPQCCSSGRLTTAATARRTAADFSASSALSRLPLKTCLKPCAFMVRSRSWYGFKPRDQPDN